MARAVYSKLMRAVGEGRFVFTGEVEPLKTADAEGIVKAAERLRDWTVACNVTDNPRARAYMSSVAASHIMQSRTGVEAVCQMTVRDRNRIALQSDILGAAALGIRNVLTMSGDHTTFGDNPQAMPVYDIDTAHFVRMVRLMVDEGCDLAGNRVAGEVRLHVGITGNPNAEPLEMEIMKIEKKVELGAEFMQTQATFDIERAKEFLREMGRLEIPVILGIFPCRSYATAEYLRSSVPGITVPDEFMEQMKRADAAQDRSRQREKIDDVNIEFFSSMIKELRKTERLAGMHVMTIGYERIVKALAERV